MSHRCNDSCFGGRNSDKQLINCFACDHKCSLKCHKIYHAHVISALRSESHAVFLCNLCLGSVCKKNRQSISSRKSSNVPVGSTAPSLDIDRNDVLSDNTLPHDLNTMKSDISTLLISFNNLNDRFISLNETCCKIKDDVAKRPNTSNTSIDYPINDEIVNINKNDLFNNLTIDNIFKLSLKLDAKISKLHTIDDEKTNLQHILSALDNKYSKISSNHNGSLPNNLRNLTLNNSLIDNWSMHNDSVDDTSSGRPSLLIKQSVDDGIMEILRRSEQTTWDTLDYLTKEVRALGDKLDGVFLRAGSINDHRQNEPCPQNDKIQSPLVDSIFIDSINDKINMLIDKFNNLSHQFDTDSENNRVRKPVERHNLSNHQTTSGSSATGSDDLDPLAPEFVLNTSASAILEDTPRNQSSSPTPPSSFSSSLEKDAIAAMASLDNPLSSQVPITGSETMTSFGRTINDDITATTNGNIQADDMNHGQHNQTVNPSDSNAIDTVRNKDIHKSKKTNQTKTQIVRTDLNQEFHLRKLSPSVTVDHIISYILSKLNSNQNSDHNDLRVFRLTKKNQDISRLKFVNFKIETNETVAKAINNNDFWLRPCSISPFIRKGVCNLHSYVNDLTQTGDESVFLDPAQTHSLTRTIP